MLSIRKIGVVGRTYRHLNRYRQILSVLFRYGFEDLVDLLKIEQYLEIGLQVISRKRRDRLDRLTRHERIRMALVELGASFIKLGQVLSTRPDLVPAELTSELAKLQNEVPPVPFDEVQRILTEELGHTYLERFEVIEEAPLASGSIGQVHCARLKEGDHVVLKVQRPGIRRQVEVDLEIMLHLATLMERHVEEISLHRPVKIVEEFARVLENEIDYHIEAGNMERFGRMFLDDPTVYVPKVYRDVSTSRVLTMELVEGIKVSEIEQIEDRGLDPKLITARGANLVLRQVFDHGFFHADPHPGNIFVLAQNTICLLDFGMTGSVDLRTREDFVDLIESVVRHDAEGTTHALLKLTNYDTEPDVRELERDVADFLSRHLYRPLKDIKFSLLLQQLLELVSHHHLRLPPDLFLMMKALSTLEGVARMLNPEFDLVSHTAPFVKRIRMARFEPQRFAGDMFRLSAALMRFLQDFPRDATEIVRLLRQQKYVLRMDLQGLENLMATHDQSSNRLAFAIVIAALVIGSALIVISNTPPLFHGISVIGIIGFFAAAILGIWLLVAILRKGSL